MSSAPIPCRYEGEGEWRAVSPYWQKRADKDYVIGECYPMAEHYPRSQASHNHEFAWLHEAWQQLPEQYATEAWAQSEKHLRKFALIRTGYCDTTTYPCGSRAEAERWAARLRPLDEFSIVVVSGTTVQRFTAQSQSRRAMGGKLFNESKAAILDYIAGLIGISPDELQRNTAQAA